MNSAQKKYLKGIFGGTFALFVILLIMLPLATLLNFLLFVAPIAFLALDGWEHPVLWTLGTYAVVICGAIIIKYIRLMYEEE